jgi:hypothetical protein
MVVATRKAASFQSENNWGKELKEEKKLSSFL